MRLFGELLEDARPKGLASAGAGAGRRKAQFDRRPAALGLRSQVNREALRHFALPARRQLRVKVLWQNPAVAEIYGAFLFLRIIWSEHLESRRLLDGAVRCKGHSSHARLEIQPDAFPQVWRQLVWRGNSVGVAA